MEELLTSDSITIWFYRMFSVCRNCGTLLHRDNCYQRDDTRSHLHTYCKTCYIEFQKARNSQVVKPSRQYYYLINKTRPVFFDTKEEKDKYLADRKSLAKFSAQTEDYSSRVGCTESWNTNSKLLCDQCGGVLAYNPHGELECTQCNLISDFPMLEIERNISFDKQPYKRSNSRDSTWSTDSYWNFECHDWEHDEGAFDFYYSRCYSKRLKKSSNDLPYINTTNYKDGSIYSEK